MQNLCILSIVILFALLLQVPLPKGIVMKKICISLLALCLAWQVAAQEQPALKDRDYYLTKSRNQKTTGWILAGAGVAMMLGGVAMAESTNDWADFDGVFVMLAGIPVSLSSIPFFISSGNNKAKAAAMVGPGLQTIQFSPAVTRLAPGISIRIAF